MKQSLALVIEQIQSGLFSYDELVEILGAIKDHINQEHYEPTSRCDRLVMALEVAQRQWSDR